MTTLTIIENVMMVFPNIKEQQVIIDLDDLQKSFSNDTGLLTGTGSLSSISTSVGWTLPSNFLELHGQDPVRFYTSAGVPKYLGDYNYAYEIQFGKFYIYSLTETPITGLSTEIDSAYIHYRKKPTTITTRSTFLEIEEEFTKGLEHGLLADYFGKYPTPIMSQGQVIEVRDLNSAKWHQTRFDEFRIRAKRYAYIKEESKEAEVQNYQHAGKHQLVRRPKDASLGSTSITQVTSLGEIYAKFALYNINTSDSGEIAEALQVGYTTISGSKSGVTFTLTSTAEFGVDTFIESNNDDVTWVYNSSSSIVITLPGSFTNLSIQIYEYT
jgi:hypothetical protein